MFTKGDRIKHISLPDIHFFFNRMDDGYAICNRDNDEAEYRFKCYEIKLVGRVIMVDMDEVMVNFYEHPLDILNIKKKRGCNYEKLAPQEMFNDLFWANLLPHEGAIEAIKELIEMGYDVNICTQPVANYPESYKGKVEWVMKYLPELTNKIIMTQDKSLIGGDYLIDDRESWCESFNGEGILFDRTQPKKSWEDIVNKFKMME